MMLKKKKKKEKNDKKKGKDHPLGSFLKKKKMREKKKTQNQKKKTKNYCFQPFPLLELFINVAIDNPGSSPSFEFQSSQEIKPEV